MIGFPYPLDDVDDVPLKMVEEERKEVYKIIAARVNNFCDQMVVGDSLREQIVVGALIDQIAMLRAKFKLMEEKK